MRLRHRNLWALVAPMAWVVLSEGLGGSLTLLVAGCLFVYVLMILVPTNDIPFRWVIDAKRGGIKIKLIKQMWEESSKHQKPVWKWTYWHNGPKGMETLMDLELDLPDTHMPICQVIGKRSYVLMGVVNQPCRRPRGGKRIARSPVLSPNF